MFWLKHLYVLDLLSDARGISGGNFDRIRSLKSKFDPDRIFTRHSSRSMLLCRKILRTFSGCMIDGVGIAAFWWKTRLAYSTPG